MKARTKAVAIAPMVKQAVSGRDSWDGCPCCVLCGRPNSPSNAHYISRAQGGLGIEENILTLCQDCHRAYDQSDQRTTIREELRDYLMSKYPGWDESKLIYRR